MGNSSIVKMNITIYNIFNCYKVAEREYYYDEYGST